MNTSVKNMMIVLLTTYSLTITAQINTAHLDSIPFSKPKRMFKIYEFNHTVLTKASYGKQNIKKAENSRYSTKDAAKDFGADVAEAIFGGFFESTTSKEVEWLMLSTIHCNNEWLNWDIEMYCHGELHKEKVKVENNDGSKSVQTIKTILMDWEAGASAFIIENERAIGKFIVINRPRDDSLFYQANKDVFDEPKVILKSAYKNKFYTDALNRNLNEYAVVGKFRDENFVLIANGETRNMWFFINGKLMCVFQPDLDDLMIRKKDRIMPYILIDNEVTESQLVDWFRLTLVSRYFSTTIGKNSFPN